MYAIIETAGKQYRVSKGDKLRVEKINADVESEVTFDKIILLGKDDAPVIGTPYVEGASVQAKVVEHGKEDKVTVFRYRRKKNYRKLRNHRQQYTLIHIESING